MMKVHFSGDAGAPANILCIGAHSDDIEIGCGGAILRLVQAFPESCFVWLVLSAEGERAVEARESSNAFLANVAEKKVLIHSFRDGYFPYQGDRIKDVFESMKNKFSPDLIFTHSRNDLHQDHRMVSDLTWNTFRNHLILEYEIPKYDGDLGAPNFFVLLDEGVCRKKVGHIISHFRTQKANHWFHEETFWSLLRIRGLESNAPDGYAEGFYCRKMVF